MRYYCAPLQGITTWNFRRLHAQYFPGVDRYYMPFFSPTKEHLITPREWKNLDPDRNAGVPAVPQLMGHNATDFLWAVDELAGLGYQEINFNLGCPSGTVICKKKGSGFLAYPEELDRFFYEIFSRSPEVKLTVKTRLGLKDPAEFARILEIYNRYPIAELTIHPRIQKDFYKFPARRAEFARYLPQCRMPVCYNGDLFTPADCRSFHAEFPAVEAVMLGRGLIADPALAGKLQGGKPVEKLVLERFMEELFASYCVDFGQQEPAVQRMKETWFYVLHLFADSQRTAKKMRRVKNPAEYAALTVEIFRELPLLEETAGAFSE